MSMVHVILLALPLLTAFTAWGTAYVLLYSVLYPLQPIRMAGITIQGFIPSLLKNDANGMAALLAKEIMSTLQPDKLTIDTTSLRPTIEAHLDTYLRIRLREKMPVIASFIGDSTLAKLKESMIEEIDALLPQVMASYVSSSVTPLVVQQKVLAIIEAITPQKLEELAGPVLKQARRRIPLLMAILGLFLGAIIAAVVYCLL